MLRTARRSALPAGLLVLALAACSAPAEGRTPPAAPPPSAAASPSTSSPSSPSPASPSSSRPAAAPRFDLGQRSVDDPASLWVVVDKLRPLRPKSWAPADLVAPDVPHTNAPLLREQAARALERLVAEARADGVRVVSLSAYRPYPLQRSIFDRNVAALGQEAAERLTARPGYSEHQTGLTDDLGDGSGRCAIQTCFAGTPAGGWLAANAWRYGFILRYPRGEQRATGIQWEPWHFRYVGVPLARHMRDTRQRVLERVFGLPDSPDYAAPR